MSDTSAQALSALELPPFKAAILDYIFFKFCVINSSSKMTSSSTHNVFAVPTLLPKSPSSLVGGSNSPVGGSSHSRQSFSPTTTIVGDGQPMVNQPNYMANQNSPVQMQAHSFTPPPVMHQQQQSSYFTRESALNRSSSNSFHQTAVPLFEAFNEDDEDEDDDDEEDEDDEDALYRNFVDADAGHLEMGTSSGNLGHQLYASANFEANSVAANGGEHPTSLLTRSFPSTSSSMMMGNGGGGVEEAHPLSASFIQSTKQLSTFDPSSSFELPSSSSGNIYLCYWVDCYKQFSSQSQLVSFRMLCCH